MGKRCCHRHFTEMKLSPQELSDFPKSTVLREWKWCLVPVLFQRLVLGHYDRLFFVDEVEGELKDSSVACRVISQGKCGKHAEKVVHFLTAKDMDAHSSCPGLLVDSKEKAFAYKGSETLSPWGEWNHEDL